MVRLNSKVRVIGHLKAGCESAKGITGIVVSIDDYNDRINRGLSKKTNDTDNLIIIKTANNEVWGINSDACIKEIKPMKIYCDLDGVVFNTIKRICQLYDEDFQYYKKYEKVHWTKINTWNFEELKAATPDYINLYFNQKRFFDGIEYMDNTKEFLEQLYLDGYEITFVSSGYSPNLKGKEIWIQENHPYCDFIGVNFKEHSDKSHIDMCDGIFIDDSFNNLKTSNASVKICFGDIYPWNEKWDGIRSFNWTDVYKLIVSLVETTERNND